MTALSYAIIGTGAVGGYYGACLQRAGAEVHFLLHTDFEHVRAHGLRIESKSGDFELPRVHAYGRAADLPPCDVAIVALKTTQNHRLPELLPPAVKTDGCVVMLQNGLGPEEDAARVVPADRIVGGLSFLCSNKVGPGHIRHLDYGAVVLARYAPDGAHTTPSERMRGIAADLDRAGIPVELMDDLVLARWKKLVWNIPFSGLSVALNALTSEIMSDPDSRALALDLMHEAVAGAGALGRTIPAAFVEKMVADTARMPPYLTSMKLDYDHKRPMEVETIFGTPWRRARAAGADLTRLGTLYRELKFLDAWNR